MIGDGWKIRKSRTATGTGQWKPGTEMLKDREPAPQASIEEMESEPPKKKMALLLMESKSVGSCGCINLVGR